MRTSVQRICVYHAIRGESAARFVAATRKLIRGHPHDLSTDVGSLITEPEAERVEAWIREAVEAGAQLLSGGGRNGARIEPAVLADVPEDAKICCRDALGPLVSINSDSSLDEAIRLVNNSDYGHQAGSTRGISTPPSAPPARSMWAAS